MDFLDQNGNIFTLETYYDKTGYELKQNNYIFWVDNPVADFDLSINTYYLKQITPYFGADDFSIFINYIASIKVELNSDRFSLIKYTDISSDGNLTIDLNKINNLQEITYTNDDLICERDEEGTACDAVIPFFVLAKSSDEGTFTTNALITITFDFGDQQIDLYSVITIGATFIGEDEKFSININNLGFTIPKGVLNAVYQGELNLDNYQGNYNNFDFSLYNSKLREYLLYNKSLKNNKGNYSSIKSHLDWFGWGADLVLTKLLKTDNQFLTQYLDRDYQSNNDNNVLINHFAHTALINVRLAQNEILYDYYKNDNCEYKILARDQQDFNCEFAGENIPQTADLFDKYVPVVLDEEQVDQEYYCKFQYLEPFYRYSLNTILIKLAFLKYYYKKYFLPIHVDALNADVNQVCFIPDLKLYTATRSGYTTPMLFNSENNYVIIGKDTSDSIETIFLSRSTCYINNYYIQFSGYTEHENLEMITQSETENLFEVREMHAKIPLRFYQDPDEYFNTRDNTGSENNDYIYNINIILSKYNKDLNRFTTVHSSTSIFTKNLVGNSENFILIPNLNGTNHDTTWYDSEDNLYRLDVCSNGSWFSKTFKIEFPPVNFNLGYLQYTYQTEEELLQGVSPFSTSLGETFMREPGLVTLDNINFSRDTAFGNFINEDETVNQNYINLYKDNYNIPSRVNNPELYNIILYFDYDQAKQAFEREGTYESVIEQFKQSLYRLNIGFLFENYFDFYIIYQPEICETDADSISDNILKAYVVLISKQTSSAKCFIDFNNIINKLKETNNALNDEDSESDIKYITTAYRFLINRYSVVPYNDNTVDTNKLLTCSVSSVYDVNIPFNISNGLKWNFVPYSFVNNQAFNVTSKADIALVSIPRHHKQAPSGYYNIYLNYSLNGYETVSVKAPYKILFK